MALDRRWLRFRPDHTSVLEVKQHLVGCDQEILSHAAVIFQDPPDDQTVASKSLPHTEGGMSHGEEELFRSIPLRKCDFARLRRIPPFKRRQRTATPRQADSLCFGSLGCRPNRLARMTPANEQVLRNFVESSQQSEPQQEYAVTMSIAAHGRKLVQCVLAH